MGSGDAYVSGWEQGLKSGHSFAAFVDLRTRSWASIGLSVEWQRVRPVRIIQAQTMLDISVNLKGSYQRDSSRFFVRPCLSFGYGNLQEIGGLPSANFLILQGTLESLWFPRHLFCGFIGEVGVIGSPLGKPYGDLSSKSNVTANPRLLMRFGLAFRDLPGL